MCEEKRKDVASSITYTDNLSKKINTESVPKISKSKSKEDEIKTSQPIPWNVFLLGLTRIVFQLLRFFGSNKTLTKNEETPLSQFARMNKYQKYAIVPEQKPVLYLVWQPYSIEHTISILLAIGMLLCVAFSSFGIRRRWCTLLSFLLCTCCLLDTAMDLTHALGASVTHCQLLQARVGTGEALFFLIMSLTVNMAQWVLWLAVLKFQKSSVV